MRVKRRRGQIERGTCFSRVRKKRNVATKPK
jgi:hypothetical protein